MKIETATNRLNRDIILLEERRCVELKILKEQLHTTYESLKPINLIKDTFKEVTESPDIKEGIGKAAIGLVSGYFVKNILFRSSVNPLKKLAGIAVQAMVANFAAKNSDEIKNKGENIFKTISSFVSSKIRKATTADVKEEI